MTVVGLHPEELFDKLLDGELTGPERERLNAHLASCEVCRFEHAARADFEREALALHLSSQPPELPLRPALQAPEVPPQPVRAAKARVAPRRRWMLALAAAALIVATGAVASGVATSSGFHGVRELFAGKPPHAAPQTKVRASGPLAAARPVEPADIAPAETAPAAPTVEAPAIEATPIAASHADVSHAATRRGASQSAALAGSPLSGETADAPEKPASAELPAKASFQPETPAAEPQTAAKLFGDANQARRAGDVARASELYHALQAGFPGSPEAELSRVTLSLLLLDTGDARGALAGFDRYLAGASHGLEAEALVGRARALGRLGQRDQEASAWREVERRYPKSVYGRQASERLAALGQQ